MYGKYTCAPHLTTSAVRKSPAQIIRYSACFVMTNDFQIANKVTSIC